MKIYSSNNLSIYKRDHMLIQEWEDVDLSIDDFQTELKTFLSFYEVIRPQSVLWLQENFKLQIPKSLYQWIENDIVKRQHETGLKNIAFTVSSDMLSHLSVMASFEKTDSVIQPNFFTDKNAAKNHLNKDVFTQKKLEYSVQKLDGEAKIEIELNFDLLPKVILELDNIKKEQRVIDENIIKMNSLTLREMEIFKLIANGYSSKEISIKLYIETSTISTHRKNIIKKLNIKRSVDLFIIARAFNLLA